MLQLMEKAGFQALVPVSSSDSLDDDRNLSTLLAMVKSLNARYDKSEALAHVKSLLDKYNIQLDQLIDRRGLA